MKFDGKGRRGAIDETMSNGLNHGGSGAMRDAGIDASADGKWVLAICHL